MIRKLKFIIPFGVMFIAATAWITWYNFQMPTIDVLQATRSIVINKEIGDDFVISPVKIRVVSFGCKKEIVIPVTIFNGKYPTRYVVGDKEPAAYTYMKENGRDYSFEWDKAELELLEHASGIVNFKIVKNSWFPSVAQEKGIGIMQTTVYKGTSIVRCYVFEILLDAAIR